MKPKLELNLIATTYGGPTFYFPAIRNLEHDIWYWPNVSFRTETEAHEWAIGAVSRLHTNYIDGAQVAVNSWNIFQI